MDETDQTFRLPRAEPTLILLGSDQPEIMARLRRNLVGVADAIDLRSEVLWVEVADGHSFLTQILDDVSDGNKSAIRIAFAEPQSTPQDLVHRALMAPTLDIVADRLEQEELASEPLDYEVRYQPIVRLSNRSIVGFEALLRARLGNEVIGAEELIARATKGGWLPELDQLGRQLAIRGVGPWLGAGLLFLNIMAPEGTFDLSAARRTIRHAEDIGLEPDQLVFETAERNRYVDLDLAAAQLTKLRSAGVRLAIDDVGDGYSSLRVATSFKPDVLKLAGDLIASLPSSEATAIIQAVVDLAHRTGAWVVAEHVETEEQARVLRTLEVDWGQGNLFGTPEPMVAG
ncbi:MAG: EAL domain-containing protein [Actinomycetia bacterium]|nr:EAL domain-containing protein [Actinomycetes bacterium]MCP4222210.1 EAL domain-containing protein [Actinomycetes bacterium]MCP5030191.1 EAL domain-containing protein [Actinomycetes bacterium]